jgi:transposase
VAGKDVIMSKPYPREFREDVVRVALGRAPGVTVEQVAKDFGVHPTTLTTWLARVRAAEDAAGSGLSSAGVPAPELRELRQRNRLLEQENEVLRRAAAYLSQANLPGKGGTRS